MGRAGWFGWLGRPLKGFGLRGSLLRRIGGAVLLIFVAISWLNYSQASSSLQKQAEATGRAQAESAANQVDGVVRTLQGRVQQLAAVSG
ncbi:MAG TPA: hypothetical protein VNL71_22025, partial [Chloroflexota bacterium]|nr:hypothetical protein [Chloroflexota bacterium]